MNSTIFLADLLTCSGIKLARMALATALTVCAVTTSHAGDASRLSVSHAKSGFSLQEVQRLEQETNLATLLSGGDVALYWSSHISRSMPTAIIPRLMPTRMLEKAINQGIGAIRAESALGNLSLDEFLVDPRSYAQSFVVVYRGRIVYEQYPGMRPQDSHFWASNAKPLVSLLIDLLIDDGILDQNQTYGHYMPDFRGTAWENIRLIDILDMTPGLDTAEDDRTRRDPNSIAIRTFLAEFNEPYGPAGGTESVRDVLKSARKISEPGASFDYGSPVTQALVLLTEEVTGKRWADLFDERVWSKMGVEGGLQIHLAPDGMAAVHGLVSSRLRDMARFGMLYTPSWNRVTDTRIVTPKIIQRIRDGVREGDFFVKSYIGSVYTERLNDTIRGNSRQWDTIFEDGDFFKSGLMGQGLYVSPDRDLVIAYFSTNPNSGLIQRYLRPLAESEYFNAESKKAK